MSLKTKLTIAFAVSMVLMLGLSLLLLLRPSRRNDGTEGRHALEKKVATESSEPAESAEATEIPPPAVVDAVPKSEEPAAGPVVFSPDEVWTLTGRIVRPDDSGALWPVEGAEVALKPHPRRTKPEDAPPPQKMVTGADGRFELPGCPGRLSMRVEIDEPSSAFRAFSFQLGDPDSTGRRDLGDIPLEAAMTLKIELVGPKGEAVEKGYILVGRETSVQGLALASLRINDSRREAREVGGGKYVLERTGAGLHSLRVMAPGCAGAQASVEMPREDPFVVRLAEGRRLAGTVLSSGGKPIRGAEVQVDSGPNLSEPDPKTSTDEAGRFLFDVLSEGEYEVSARSDGFASERKRSVPSGTEDLEFHLPLEAVLSGKVVAEEDGKSVPKAQVTLLGIQGESFNAASDAKGLFTVRKISPGKYAIGATHLEFAAASAASREIQEGEKIEGHEIRLPAGTAVAGSVVDAETQEPVKDAQVFFDLVAQGQASVQGPGMRRTGKTGADGRFGVKGLGEGSYSLSARAQGFLAGKAQTVFVAPDGPKEFMVTLDLGGSIAGRVLDDAGSAVVAATVRPSVSLTTPAEWNGPLSNVLSTTAQTDSDGRFKLEGLPAHKAYTVRASHKDYAQGSAKGVPVGPREAVEGIEIALARGGAIRGRVLDAQGGGIAGASVQASEEKQVEEQRWMSFAEDSNGKNAATDADGNYVLSPLGAARYTVRAQARDRMSASQTGVEVADGKPTDRVDLVLGAGETLRGRVTDAEGQPISGVNLNAYAEESAQTQTGADGRFELKGLKKGQVQLNLYRQGFEQKSLQVAIPGREVDLQLDRLGKIIGTLRARSQETFSNYDVMATLKPAGGDERGSGGRTWRSPTRNDPSGRFEIEVGPGTYVLHARVPGFAPAESSPITLKAAERVEGIIIDLTKGGTIRGVVVALATGEPIEGANVQVLPEQGTGQRGGWAPFGLPSASSAADGSFTLDGIPDGVLAVTAAHEKYSQARVTGVQVREGGTATVRLELGRGGGIRGTVTKGGAAVAGAQVFVSKSDPTAGENKQAATDAEGRFELNGLSPGEYRLFVTSNVPRRAFNAQQVVTVVEAEITQADIAQAVGMRLFGRVTSGGAPVPGGRIEAVQPERGWGGGNAQIEPTGDYSIEIPGPGAYMLMIRLAGQGGGGGAKADVIVPAGAAEFRFDIDLPSGEISGVVLDAATGDPVQRAEVVAFDGGSSSRTLTSMIQGMKGMASTDAQGQFAITALGPGVYTVRVMAQGYTEGAITGIRIDARRPSRDNRVALDRGITFRARVVDPAGQPVVGASVFLRSEDGEFVMLPRPFISGEEGLVEVLGVRPAMYQVTVVHASYAASRALVEAAEGREATLRVQPGARVSVQVTDRQHRAVEGASIEILNSQGENVLDDLALAAMMTGRTGLATGADGTLVLEQIAPGKYRIAARLGEARSREEKLTVEEGKTVEARLTLAE